MEKLNKVVLDTNMLMAIGELKIDIIDGLEEKLGKAEFFVPEEVTDELKKLKEKGRTKKNNAEIAEKIIEKYCSVLKSKKKNADERIEELAGEYIIATNDKELRKRIKKKGFKTAFIRQKKVIVIE